MDIDKNQLFELFVNLYGDIWSKMTHALGDQAAVSIVERALLRSKRSFPFLANLFVDKKGMDFSQLKAILKDLSEEELAQALDYFLKSTFEVLAIISGNTVLDGFMGGIDRLSVKELINIHKRRREGSE